MKTATFYFEEAKKIRKQKDLVLFIENITLAISLANDIRLKAQATALKAEVLLELNQYKHALRAIHEALKYNKDDFRLRRLAGIARAYLGDTDGAIELFKQLVAEVGETNHSELVSIYINIDWVLDMKGEHKKKKEYLDLALSYYNEIPDEKKWRLSNNLSVYYFHMGEFEKSISELEKALQYCKEENLPELYVNIAEVYLAEYPLDEVPQEAFEYLAKGEEIATKYDQAIALAYVFETKALLEVKEGNVYKAADTLALAFQHAFSARAYSTALGILKTMIRLEEEKRVGHIEALQTALAGRISDVSSFFKN